MYFYDLQLNGQLYFLDIFNNVTFQTKSTLTQNSLFTLKKKDITRFIPFFDCTLKMAMNFKIHSKHSNVFDSCSS